MLGECEQPGASVARVALRHGLNANLVHKWRRQERAGGAAAPAAEGGGGEFIALPMATPMQAGNGGQDGGQDIRVQLRRGATAIDISWPVQAAGDCAAWLAQWLR